MSGIGGANPERSSCAERHHVLKRRGDFWPVSRGDTMKDDRKTKKQLIDELGELRQRIAGFEHAEDRRLSAARLPDGQEQAGKRAANEVKESEERYRNLVENSPDVVYSLDAEGKITSVNKAMKTMFGYEPEETIGRNFAEFASESAMPRAMKSVRQVQAGKKVTAETVVVDKEGKPHWVEFSTVPRMKDGKVIGSQGIVRDVTERVRAQEEIGTERKKFEAYIENMVDGLCVNDTEGTIVQVNKALVKMFGYRSPKEMIGKTIFGHVSERELPRMRKRFMETVKNRESGIRNFEVICSRRDGAEFPVSFNIRHLWEKDEYVGSISIARDITEPKRVTEALRKSEEKYRKLVQTIPECVYSAQPDGEILYMSPAVKSIFGYSAKQFQKDKNLWIRLIDKDDKKELLTKLDRLLRKGEPYIHEFRMKRKDGRVIWVRDHAKAVLDERGKPVTITGIIYDITERKEAGEQLLFKNALLEAQSETSIDGLLAVDGEGQSILVNRRFGEMLHMPREVLDTKDGNRILQHVLDQLKDPDTFLGKVRYLYNYQDEKSRDEIEFKDGRVYDRYSSPLIDANGKHHGRIWYFRDISQRKKLEEELRASEERFRKIFENANDGMIYLSKSGRILEVNDKATQLFGGSKDELLGKHFTKVGVISLRDIPKLMSSFDGILASKQAHINIVVKNKKGQEIPLECSASLIRRDNKVVGMMVIARDTTERRKVQEALKEYSERLEEMVEERTRELQDAQEELVRKERLAVLGQLAGGLGHELRNPLGAIKNAAYFLNMVLENPESEVKQALEIMEKEVDTSERVISSLLGFAHPKPPTRRKVDINHVVQEALSRTRAPENVQVVSELGEGLPTLLADPDQLGQVFGNIIVNAVQAMPEGGRLVVRTMEERERGDRGSIAASPCLLVSVSDTGVGMSEEILRKLFEPLLTTKAKGLGLGLALSKILVEAHGGTIEVASPSTELGTSEEGKGSTLTVRLPAAEQRCRGAEP